MRRRAPFFGPSPWKITPTFSRPSTVRAFHAARQRSVNPKSQDLPVDSFHRRPDEIDSKPPLKPVTHTGEFRDGSSRAIRATGTRASARLQDSRGQLVERPDVPFGLFDLGSVAVGRQDSSGAWAICGAGCPALPPPSRLCGSSSPWSSAATRCRATLPPRWRHPTRACRWIVTTPRRISASRAPPQSRPAARGRNWREKCLDHEAFRPVL